MRKYIFISFVIAVLIAYLLPFQFLLNFAHDDSFFYIKTASNFSKGLGSTFDGINPTNGYHPLYFILLSVIFYIPNIIFKASPENLYRLVVLLHLILIILIWLFTVKASRNIFKNEFKKTSFLLFTLLAVTFVFIRDFGLESHLACLLVAFFLYIKSKEFTNGKNYIIIKSLILAGLFLTRTDYIFSIVPLMLVLDIYLSPEKKKYILSSLPIIFVFIFGYYLSNYIFFGAWDTVSGRLLNSFPVLNIKNNINALISNPQKLFNQFARIILLVIVFSIFSVYSFKSYKEKNIKSKFYLTVWGLGAGSIIFTFIHLLFNNYGIREWYMSLPILVAVIMISILLNDRKYMLNISLIFSAILLIYIFYGTRIKNIKYSSAYDFAKNLSEVVTDKENIYQVDFCGIVGFFSGRNVIDGDGLINSFEYLGYLNSGRIDEYLSKYNVKYYSTYSYRNILNDSVYTDDSFSDIIKGKVFYFGKESLVLEQPFSESHIAFELKGSWYLFKLKRNN